MASSKPYTLYTAGTPNGWKASITLEEIGVPYHVHYISLSKNEQKQDWFTKINPNGRIPALVDHQGGDFPIFESGAILWYLAEKHHEANILPQDVKGKAEVSSWLNWQMGGVGPMAGQAIMFLWYAPEDIPFAVNRYVYETDRLYTILDLHLRDRDWVAAGQFTIADIALYPWVWLHWYSGVPLDDKPHLTTWLQRCGARPAVQRGLLIPENSLRDALKSTQMLERAIRRLRSVEEHNEVARKGRALLEKMAQEP